MRIITLWQPWASLIALRLKQYETRDWPTNYRGQILIHAAKRKIDPIECQAILGKCAQEKLRMALCDITAQPNYGCVVAIADLTNCIDMAQSWHSIEAWVSSVERAVGYWEPGRYAWKLHDVQPLPSPIVWRGSQGLKPAPDELVNQVRLQFGQPPAIAPTPAGLGKNPQIIQPPLWT